MTATPFRQVLAFHRKFGCHVGSTPAVPDAATADLRFGLISEEHWELTEALAAGDLPGIADAAADLIYVVLGTCVSYGIDLEPVWEAVHAANIGKVGGATREDGKILKPPGWTHPDIAAILAKQGPIGDDEGGAAR